jgi:spore coat polysaccharide biosynthesis predicted glycosyltransferase SpsG/L-amino acid N-acyltransferase YncA
MKTHSTKLLIRADAGASVGTGHVMRMMAMGQACRKVNGDVTFVCGTLPKGIVSRIEKLGMRVIEIANSNCDSNDARDTADIALAIDPDWIVLDGYRFGDEYQARIRRPNSRLMVVDDFGHAEHVAADLILNQNAYAKPENYGLKVRAADLLLGCRYALLRPEFVRRQASEANHVSAFVEENEVGDTTERATAIELLRATRRTTRKTARRILVTMGGCDEDNWTRRTVEAIGRLKLEGLIVDVVVGAGYRHQQSLMEVKQKIDFELRLHRNVDRISALMNRVDMAVTAGGSTCYELANCGVPGIAIPVADNQNAVVNELSMRGSLEKFDPAGDWANELTKQIRLLIRDPERRRKMAIAGQKIIDGYGATRIVRHLVASLIHLRSASMEDAERLLAWRNDPEVRSVSFTHDAITLDHHRGWLKKQLHSPACDIWIAEDRSGIPIGQVRLNYDVQVSKATVSIVLDHTLRARGMGTVLIEKVSRFAFFNEPSLLEIVAQIKPGNVASERAFAKAGFRPIAPTTIEDQIALQYRLLRSEDIVAQQSRRRTA